MKYRDRESILLLKCSLLPTAVSPWDSGQQNVNNMILIYLFIVLCFKPSPDAQDLHHSTPPLFGLVEDIGKVALAAVLAVVHRSHEDAGATLWIPFVSSQTTHFGDSRLTVSVGHSLLRRSILPSPSTL